MQARQPQRNGSNSNGRASGSGTGGGGFSVDNLFSIGATTDATPKRPRPVTGAHSASGSRGGGGGAAGYTANGGGGALGMSSSPLRGDSSNGTPYLGRTNGPPGPSRLGGLSGSSPVGFSSPAIAPSLIPATPAKPLVPFASRPSRLTVQESLNPELPLPTSDQLVSNQSRVTLRATTNPADYAYRIAFERAMERSEVLDSLIDEAAEIFKEYYQIEEFGDPTVQSQDEILVVGRLCPETDAAKMTETSTWLESSRMLGSGQRVLLKFEPEMKVRGGPPGAGGIGFFPGCLVGLRGTNGGGKLFAVKEVLMMPPIDATYTAPSSLLEQQYGAGPKQLGGHPMSVLVAAGPYTLESDLDYEPLEALIGLAKQEKPDVLILTGPFVDSAHPLIVRGEVDELPAAMFRRHISARLASLIQASPRTAVLLIPNGRDLVNPHVAYPQAPFNKEPELNIPKPARSLTYRRAHLQGVRLLPNPTMFSINEVVFGVTSVDVLWSVKSQEYFRKAPDVEPPEPGTEDPLAKDVMARTCRQLLRHRSFYPVFPSPPPSKMLDQLNLDVTHYDLVKMGSDGPDIVITPSIQKHFTRIVDSTVFLNPSFLTKASQEASAGTFARLTIHPMDKENLAELSQSGMVDVGGEPDEPVEHRVWERCRVDILKV
ncbi:hypothetical protein BMF94_2829 [Rhodotorula taiwanensis]|uniref:DNA polymerase alpha subunit B n=1 Tax=Rhodotorula taiwanensis TaxID=741276 RepID=A0A2S5BB88_9BASI|nr:hypothetical protein BMF94_2829 [Rhodotorula taiwanensis]